MFRSYNRIILHIGAPIILGVIVYAMWRGIYLIDPAQNYFPILDSPHPPGWVKYNLPDGLWFYALLTSLYFIWGKTYSRHFVSWLLLSIVMSLLLEVSQSYRFIQGTFDWNDLLAYVIAAIIFFINFYKQLYSKL